MSNVVRFKGQTYKVDFFGYVAVLKNARHGPIEKPVNGRLAARIRILKQQQVEAFNAQKR